jgi:hypothetical protein
MGFSGPPGLKTSQYALCYSLWYLTIASHSKNLVSERLSIYPDLDGERKWPSYLFVRCLELTLSSVDSTHCKICQRSLSHIQLKVKESLLQSNFPSITSRYKFSSLFLTFKFHSLAKQVFPIGKENPIVMIHTNIHLMRRKQNQQSKLFCMNRE